MLLPEIFADSNYIRFTDQIDTHNTRNKTSIHLYHSNKLVGKDLLSTKRLSCGMNCLFLFKKLHHCQFSNVLLKLVTVTLFLILLLSVSLMFINLLMYYGLIIIIIIFVYASLTNRNDFTQ